MKDFIRNALAFGLCAAVVVGICFARHPSLKTFDEIEAARIRPILPEPIYFSAPPSLPITPTFLFRGGPERNGIAFPAEIHGLKSLWKDPHGNRNLHTASQAMPAVDDSGMYVGSDSGWFRKFDLDGKLQWKFYIGTLLRGIHSTAALTADTVYIGAYNGWFYALNKSTGAPRWAIALGHAIGASTLVDGNDVYITIETPKDGFIAKLDAVTGKLIWTSPFLGEQAHSSVTLDKNHGLAIVGNNARTIVAVDMKTGDRRWVVPTKGQVKATGTLWHDHYIVGTNLGFVYSVRVNDGHVEWVSPAGGFILNSVVVDPLRNIAVVASKGGFFAYDASSGRTLWSHPFAPSDLDSFLAVTRQVPVWMNNPQASRFVVECRLNELCILDGKTGAIQKTFPLDGTYSNAPTLFKNRLYLSYAYDGVQAYELE